MIQVGGGVFYELVMVENHRDARMTSCTTTKEYDHMVAGLSMIGVKMEAFYEGANSKEPNVMC